MQSPAGEHMALGAHAFGNGFPAILLAGIQDVDKSRRDACHDCFDPCMQDRKQKSIVKPPLFTFNL